MKRKIEDVYRLHYKQLYGIAYSILKNHAEAEDVVSEGFLIFLEKCDRVDPQKALNWLYVVIANKAKEHYRINHKYIPFDYSKASTSKEDTVLFSECVESVEIHINHSDLKQQLNTLIKNNLNETQLKCVKSYYFEDLSYQEIAEKYSIKVGTVKSNLSRGKIKLRDVVVDEEEYLVYLH